MNDIVKLEVIKMPKTLIVGKAIRYSDEALNHGDNRLPAFWNRCRGENIFAPLEAQAAYVFDSSPIGVFLDWYLGDGDFSYIVGLLMREGAAVPEGYVARELPEGEVALCWVKSRTIIESCTVPFDSTAEAIAAIGRSCANMKWCGDLYHPVRSVLRDENGEVILDSYIPLD